MERGFGAIPEELDRVAAQVVDAAYRVHFKLGPGLLEHVYKVCLAHELVRRGLRVDRELELPVIYDDIRFDVGFRIDLRVNDCVIVELKAVEKLLPVHSAQVLTYLKLMGLRLGLLINMNESLVKNGIKRIAL
jgi:GxxExxY protein